MPTHSREAFARGLLHLKRSSFLLVHSSLVLKLEWGLDLDLGGAMMPKKRFHFH